MTGITGKPEAKERNVDVYGYEKAVDAWIAELKGPQGSRATNGQHPPALAGDWTDALLRNKSGTPQQTIRNFIVALQHLDPWKSTGLWYDRVREQHMLGLRPVLDDEATRAGFLVEQTTEIRITHLALMGRALDYVARQVTRDLLQEWVTTLPSVPISDLLTTWLRTVAHVPDTVSDAYVADVSRIIPVAMIARILHPGCQYRYVPILEGPENAGKSKLTKALAGRTPTAAAGMSPSVPAAKAKKST